MQRLLAVLFTVTFTTTAAAAAPVIACVSDDDIAASGRHACCGQQPVIAAPVGACCTVSLPPGQAVTEIRAGVAKHDAFEPVVLRDAIRFNRPPDPDRTWHRERHPHRGRGVPIYLEQLTLLI